MGRYRKKPVVIEAMRVPPPCTEKTMYDHAALAVWLGAGGPWKVANSKGAIEIETLEGIMRAENGDWIIRGIKGELYPCKPDIFADTYEQADAETAVANNTLPSTPMRDVDEEDKTLERAAHVGDAVHNLGKYAGEQPYRKPRDRRVQTLLTDAQRDREATAARDGAKPRKIFSDPRLDPTWKAPEEMTDRKYE